MLNESLNDSFDFECLSAILVNHHRDHRTDLDFHSAASMTSSIFQQINKEKNESKVLSTLQQEFTPETLKTFIRRMWSLKNERKLPDEAAVSALSMLLPDAASKWWEDTRAYVKNWNLAVALILKVLDDKRTLRDVWTEFEGSHQIDRHLKSFINEQRILLAEIRQFRLALTEQMEIDLIFSKLSPAIRKKIDRKRMSTLRELMKLAESYGLMDPDESINTALRCEFCNQKGHEVEHCQDKKYETEKVDGVERYRSSSIPFISVKLNGIADNVHLATDSHLNIISDQLYNKLLHRGCVFESSKQTVATYRSSKKHVLQMATVIVECNHHLIVTPVVKLQNTRGNKNCFGMNFIESCDLLAYIGCE